MSDYLNFVAQMKKTGILPLNRFVVKIPESGNASAMLSMYCTGTQMPGFKLDQAEIKIFGEKTKIARGVPNYDDITLKFICDPEMKARTFFEKWYHQILNTKSREMYYYRSYVRDIEFEFLDFEEKSSTARTFTLKEAWVKSLADVDFTSSTSNEPATFNITLCYKWYETELFDSQLERTSTQSPVSTPRPQTSASSNFDVARQSTTVSDPLTVFIPGQDSLATNLNRSKVLSDDFKNIGSNLVNTANSLRSAATPQERLSSFTTGFVSASESTRNASNNFETIVKSTQASLSGATQPLSDKVQASAMDLGFNSISANNALMTSLTEYSSTNGDTLPSGASAAVMKAKLAADNAVLNNAIVSLDASFQNKNAPGQSPEQQAASSAAYSTALSYSMNNSVSNVSNQKAFVEQFSTKSKTDTLSGKLTDSLQKTRTPSSVIDQFDRIDLNKSAVSSWLGKQW